MTIPRASGQDGPFYSPGELRAKADELKELALKRTAQNPFFIFNALSKIDGDVSGVRDYYSTVMREMGNGNTSWFEGSKIEAAIEEYYSQWTERIKDHIRPEPKGFSQLITPLKQAEDTFQGGADSGDTDARDLTRRIHDDFDNHWEGEFAAGIKNYCGSLYLNTATSTGEIKVSGDGIIGNVVALTTMLRENTELIQDINARKRRNLGRIIDLTKEALESAGNDSCDKEDISMAFTVVAAVTGVATAAFLSPVGGAVVAGAIGVAGKVIENNMPEKVDAKELDASTPAHVLAKMGKGLTRLHTGYEDALRTVTSSLELVHESLYDQIPKEIAGAKAYKPGNFIPVRPAIIDSPDGGVSSTKLAPVE